MCPEMFAEVNIKPLQNQMEILFKLEVKMERKKKKLISLGEKI